MTNTSPPRKAQGARGRRAAERRHLSSPVRKRWEHESGRKQAAERRHLSPLRGWIVCRPRFPRAYALGYLSVAAPRLFIGTSSQAHPSRLRSAQDDKPMIVIKFGGTS